MGFSETAIYIPMQPLRVRTPCMKINMFPRMRLKRIIIFIQEAPLTELASVFQGGPAIYFYIIKLECSMDIQSIKSNTMTQ